VSQRGESNPGPIAYEAIALPAELRWLVLTDYTSQVILGKNLPLGDNAVMRIAMLSYHTCPLATLGGKDTGGMNVYVRDLTRELGRRRIGVDVFTRSQDEHVPHVLHDLGFGNRIVHIPAGPEKPLPKETLAHYIPDFIQGIFDFAGLKSTRYSLIHSHYWLSGMAAIEMRKVWDIPVVQMFHTLAVMKNRIARSPDEECPTMRLDVERMLLRESDRIIAATQAEVAQIQWLYRESTDRVVVIPPGVDTSRFYPIATEEAKEFVGIPNDLRMVLYVGRIESLKGIDTLLRAVHLMVENGSFEQNPFCVAVIGGESDQSGPDLTPEMEHLVQLRDSHANKDVVTFLGKRDQDTLQYYYSAAEVVVVPSYYESFGLVALEAMACGTPVVASETGGLAFLVRDGETGFHVPAGDADALAKRLTDILEDETLLRRLGAQAASYARQYDWSTITDQILDLYGEILPRTA
jgi:D-inositol-3-phosphate glycosyltransferase